MKRVRIVSVALLVALLLTMLVGCGLPDVAVIILSIDPCISCTER